MRRPSRARRARRGLEGGLTGGLGNPESHANLADPAVRRQIATLIRQAAERDVEAAGHIEAALASLEAE